MLPHMMTFEKLDAWRVCTDLYIAMRKATEPLLETEPDLALRLRFVTLRAPCRIARGTGSGRAAALVAGAGAALNYLSECGFLLGIARVVEAMPEETWCGLDALRGRAAFYTGKIVFGGPPGFAPEDRPAPD